jgi:transcriptional regulator with XRE-family HTH domain
MSKRPKIERMLSEGYEPKAIAEALQCSTGYVSMVERDLFNPSAKKRRNAAQKRWKTKQMLLNTEEFRQKKRAYLKRYRLKHPPNIKRLIDWRASNPERVAASRRGERWRRYAKAYERAWLSQEATEKK